MPEFGAEDPTERAQASPTEPQAPPTEPQAPPTEEQALPVGPEALPDAEQTAERGTDDAAPRGSRLRTAGILGVRLGTGVVVTAAVVATVAAAAFLPLPGIQRSVSHTTVTPVPTAEQLVCPGGLLRLASANGSGANKASSLGVASVTSAATSGRVSRKSVEASDAGTGGTAAAPQLISTGDGAAASAQRTLLAGAQSETVATDEFVGLSAAACAAASGDSWLGGGATSVGRTTLLLLTNPSDVPATVSLQIFGENGAVTAPGMSGITVAAQGQRVLSVAGFAPGVVSPVVHVISRGGQVVADLEQSTVRGLEPGGIDFVGAQSQPSRSIVIPGVVVSGTAAVQGRLGESGFDDLETTLRLYSTNPKATTASVRIISEDGKVAGAPIRADLTPGAVVDLPLDELSDGNYSLAITSASPLVASVRVSTAGSEAVARRTDFAWLTAAPLLTDRTLVSVAPGMSTLHLENPTKKLERVVLHGSDGGELDASVPSGAAVSVQVVAGISYELTGFTGLHASVSGVSDGGVTGYVVSPSAPGATPIRIYP